MWSASGLEAALSLNHASEHLVTEANDSQMTGISYFFGKTPFHFPAAVTSQLGTDTLRYIVMKNMETYIMSGNFALLV